MNAAEPPAGGAADTHPTNGAELSGGSLGFSNMRKRRDFLAANSGVRTVTPAFILLVRPSASAQTRVGYTVSKKIGNAVVRNRARRRLREAARLALPGIAIAGADHVFIARARDTEIPFDALRADMGSAAAKARRKLDPRA